MNQKQETKAQYTIISLWLANELQRRGYKMLGTGYNYNRPGYHVFYFEDSKELRKEVSEIVRYGRNGKI